jgi:hypothetical protein
MEITKGRKKEKKSETRQNYCQVAWSNVFSLSSPLLCASGPFCCTTADTYYIYPSGVKQQEEKGQVRKIGLGMEAIGRTLRR